MPDDTIPRPARVRQNLVSTATPRRESVKETLESVVIAFILAFVFRAFIVEAFVIPTGSMAATLNGEHWEHTCSNCGYAFAVGANRGPDQLLLAPGDLACPNCNWAHDRIPNRTPTDAGDRILVLKWPRDFMALARTWLGPRRWDVTVFKNPSDGTTNYIKRLAGLPGEVVEIIDGDLYAARLEDLPADTIENLTRARSLKIGATRAALELIEDAAAVDEYYRLARQISREITPFLRIQRKTPEAQDAVWSVVYDHDLLPRRPDDQPAGADAPLWAPLSVDSPWRVQDRRLLFEGAESRRESIRLLRQNPLDDYGYNSSLTNRTGPLHVGDTRLRAVVTIAAVPADPAESFVDIVLSKRQDEFTGRLYADGRVALLHRTLDAGMPPRELLADSVPPLHPRQPRRIELRNVDYRVSFLVNGRAVLQTTDDDYSPDLSALRKQANDRQRDPRPIANATIAASRLNLELRHVAWERDIYYRSAVFSDDGRREPQRSLNPWLDHPGWASTGNPLLLDAGEYMMLGDNSPQSQDSRLWWKVAPALQSRPDYQLGTVPEDQIIGRAFFVYWPAGYRAWWVFNRGLIPNVGEMRWIR